MDTFSGKVPSVSHNLAIFYYSHKPSFLWLSHDQGLSEFHEAYQWSTLFLNTHLFIIVLLLDSIDEFWDNQDDMALPEQKKRLLKAKIAVALHDELGRVPKTEEIDQVFLLARVMYKTVLGLY